MRYKIEATSWAFPLLHSFGRVCPRWAMQIASGCVRSTYVNSYPRDVPAVCRYLYTHVPAGVCVPGNVEACIFRVEFRPRLRPRLRRRLRQRPRQRPRQQLSASATVCFSLSLSFNVLFFVCQVSYHVSMYVLHWSFDLFVDLGSFPRYSFVPTSQ